MVDFTQSSQIQDRSYRKGLVLGFTMAEIMLLVVFCLLLISGSVIKKTEQRLVEQTPANKNFVTLQVPRDKIVFQPDAPKPDSTGTVVALWPVLEDKEKAEVVRTLEESKLLDPSNHILEKQKIIGDLSTVELKAAIAKYSYEPSETNAVPPDIQSRLERLRADGVEWREIAELLNQKILAGHRWPPIIPLKETDGYSFDSGSAKIAFSFEQLLKNDAVPKIEKLLKEYGADTVEIIGHTDSVPVRQANKTNLDDKLGPFIQGSLPSDAILVADNAGLGLARAAAVVQVLLSDRRLQEVHFIALSAGQLLKPNGEFDFGSSKDGDPKRRRLEVRIRCSKDPCSAR